MLMKRKNAMAVLAAFGSLLITCSGQPAQARGGGGHASHGVSAGSTSHASSQGHSSGSRTTPAHFYGGRGHYHHYRSSGYGSDEQSLPPVSNQFDQYTLAQDARRVALPTSAFVHEYH